MAGAGAELQRFRIVEVGYGGLTDPVLFCALVVPPASFIFVYRPAFHPEEGPLVAVSGCHR